jgi:flavin reductase (NADH)
VNTADVDDACRRSIESEPPRHLVLAAEAAEARVDDLTFRQIMSALPSGVSVITTVDDEGSPRGLTCSAVCSLSRNPPLLLISIDNRSSVLRAIRNRGGFVVNLLRQNREQVSSIFASALTDRFAAVRWQPTPGTGLPWMPDDTVAHAECQVAATIQAGDHTVVIGAIVAGHAFGTDSSPLVYWQRRYVPWPGPTEDVEIALTLATEG